MSQTSPQITESVRRQAADNPGAWVYATDPAFDPNGEVPPYGVIGAWRVDEHGRIVGEFVTNPGYRPSAAALEWRAPESELEAVLQAVATGRASDADLLAAFATAEVWVYSRPGGGLFVVPTGDDRVVYAFSDEELLRVAHTGERASLTGRDLAHALPEGVLVLLNPGNVPFARIDPQRVRL